MIRSQREGDGEPGLERHVEARDAHSTGGELHSRKVVNGEPTFTDDLPNPPDAVGGGRDFEDGSRCETEPNTAGDKSNEKMLVLVVERYVEEDVTGFHEEVEIASLLLFATVFLLKAGFLIRRRAAMLRSATRSWDENKRMF